MNVTIPKPTELADVSPNVESTDKGLLPFQMPTSPIGKQEGHDDPEVAHLSLPDSVVIALKANILTIFQEYWAENVASMVYTRFFYGVHKVILLT